MATRSRIPFQGSGGSILPAYQTMTIGQYLQSNNGRFKLLLQADSNLVLLDNGVQIWIADKATPNSLTMPLNTKASTAFYIQYSGFLDDPTRNRVWSTQNSTFTDADQWNRTHMTLQDDGNLVSIDYRAIWATNTNIPLIAVGGGKNIIPPGTSLVPGQPYASGGFSLVFQTDGNLVLLNSSNGVVWNSQTANKGAAQAVMQEDGNFVISTAAGQVLWQTKSGGHPGAYLQVQSTGSLCLVTQTPVWARLNWTPTIRKIKVFYPDHSTGPLPTAKDWTWTFG